MNATDMRGNVIKVGQRLVYAVKGSTSCDLNEAVVESIGMTRPDYGIPRPAVKVKPVGRARSVTLHNLHTALVIAEPVGNSKTFRGQGTHCTGELTITLAGPQGSGKSLVKKYLEDFLPTTPVAVVTIQTKQV